MAVAHLTTADFDRAVGESSAAMVDFWASWCGPCKMLAPVIEEIGAAREGAALVGKVDIDQEPALAERFNVTHIPTVVFFQNGREVDRKVGVMDPETYKKTLDALS